jgi:outer membrane protein assembly factor BamB
LLLGDHLIYVLDDKSVQASNASTGKLKWQVPADDTLSIHDLYGHFGETIFIISTALNGEKHISAIDYRNGQQLWRVKIDSTINELERDMYGRGNILYCRGNSTIVMLNVKDGSAMGRYDLPSRITTNIVKDRNENLLFALENNVLVRVSLNGKVSYSQPFAQKLNRLYENGQNVYLYSFPNLYLLDALP